MGKAKQTSKKFIDTIPEIQGREFQHELPLPVEDPPDFNTPIATGASILSVHTAELHADRAGFPRLYRRMLDSCGMNQNQLADHMGVTRQTVFQLIHGYRTNPSLMSFLRWAAACGCRILIEYPRRVK